MLEPGVRDDDPDLRHRRRRTAVWVGVAVTVLVLAVLAVLASRPVDRVELGPDDPSPIGSKALVQVLRDQGVRVRATDSLTATRGAVQDPSATTIVVYDENGILDAAQVRSLARTSARIVFVQPGFEALDTIAPGVAARGAGTGTASGCRVGGLAATDRVTATGERYAVDESAASDARTCLGDATRGYGLVRLTTTSGTDLAVVGNAQAFENQHVLENANGAYALGLLGTRAQLVWYLPGDADLPPTPGDVALVPSWYAPVMGMLILVAIAGIVWRGRRFGALAIENLPVVVPASETMEGRARLYARSSARLRAIDALRIGAVDRIARDCGLPRVATLQEVVDAADAATGRSRDVVAATLVDVIPANDAELMRLAAALTDLERQVHTATRGR